MNMCKISLFINDIDDDENKESLFSILPEYKFKIYQHILVGMFLFLKKKLPRLLNTLFVVVVFNADDKFFLLFFSFS